MHFTIPGMMTSSAGHLSHVGQDCEGGHVGQGSMIGHVGAGEQAGAGSHVAHEGHTNGWLGHEIVGVAQVGKVGHVTSGQSSHSGQTTGV